MSISNRFYSFILWLLALVVSPYAFADKVAQWDLRDYDLNNTTSAFTFVSTNLYPDGSTGEAGGIRFGDQINQIDPVTGVPYTPPLAKETRCFATGDEIFKSIFDDVFFLSDFGQPCEPITFDKGAPTDIYEFTYGFQFTGFPFWPAIADSAAGGTPLTGDMSADISIDKAGNYSAAFSRLDFAGLFGDTLFFLPPTTTAPDERVVDPSLVNIQELVPLGGSDFGVAAQWVSEISQPDGGGNNGQIARWRVEGIMTVTDAAPTIFLNGANPASVPPFGSYVDDGAVCQDVVDGEITATTTPANPNISPVGDVGDNFTITYDCVDSSGNTDQLVRDVIVEFDTTPPEITLLAGPAEQGRADAPDGSTVDILVGKTYIDAGATCVDNADGDIILGTIGSPSFTFAPTFVDTRTASTDNPIVFTCTDSSGNVSEATRLVDVIADDVPPVLTLGPAPVVTISVGSEFVPNVPPSECTDTNQIDISTGTKPIDISSNVTTSPETIDTRFPHTEMITYNCEDAAGNAAEPAIQQVDIVQGETFNILSMTISDLDDDNLAGCFKFGSLNPATCDLANAFSSDNSVTGTLTGGNATIPGSGTDLDGNGDPIGIRFGTFQATKEISPGFMFTGFPFEPFTFDPPSEAATPPNGVVLVSTGSNSLIINSFPFGGLYSSSKPNAFFLDPDEGTLSTQITADNDDDDGTTRSFNYLMTWSHLITNEEDPTGQFPTFNAFWRLEGKVTVDANSVPFNNPPIIDYISASQGALASTSTVVSTDGNVTVTAAVVEPDGDGVTYDWSASDIELTPVGGTSSPAFVFDPSAVSKGTYNILLTVTDDAAVPESATSLLAIKVVGVAPVLGTGDSDGDGIPDDVEGYGDTDMDGLPDYQDAIDGMADPGRNRVDFSDPDVGDITSDKGILVLGSTAFRADKSLFIVTQKDISAYGGPGGSSVTDGTDPLTQIAGLGHSGGGINDWTVNGLFLGDTVCVIVPQLKPLPNVPIYRRYSLLDGWVDFKTSGADTLASAPRVGGVCSENPDDYDAASGFVEGDECIRVCVTDGAANDLDLSRNGSVSDPAAVAKNGAVPKSDPSGSSGGGCMLSQHSLATGYLRLDLWLLLTFLLLTRITAYKVSRQR